MAGEQSPAEARRVVSGLGVGKHVMVKLASSGRNFAATFRPSRGLLPDGKRELVSIPYAEVTQLGKNLSVGAIFAIVPGIADVVVVPVVLLGETAQIQIQLESPEALRSSRRRGFHSSEPRQKGLCAD